MVGTAAAVNCVVIVGLQWLVVRLTGDRDGAGLLVVVGAIWVGSWLLLEAALFVSPHVAGALFVVAFAIFAVGETMYAPILSPLTAAVAPPGLVGTTLGALAALRTGISAVGPLVAGAAARVRPPARLRARRTWSINAAAIVLACGCSARRRSRTDSPAPSQVRVDVDTVDEGASGHSGSSRRRAACLLSRGEPVSDRFQPATYPVPASDALVEFMRDRLGRRGRPGRAPAGRPLGRAAPGQARRAVSRASGIVIPAGPLKPRANDTDYRFRADTAHVYLTGNQTSDAVLVIDDGEADAVLPAAPRQERRRVLARRPLRRGLGRPPSLAHRGRGDRSASRAGTSTTCRTCCAVAGRHGSLRGVDPDVDALVPVHGDGTADRELATSSSSEMRLVKDAWEVEQLQDAIDSTILGFEDSVREWDNVVKYGERWIEGTFWRRARPTATTSATSASSAGGPHATTLHWIENDGPSSPASSSCSTWASRTARSTPPT